MDCASPWKADPSHVEGDGTDRSGGGEGDGPAVGPRSVVTNDPEKARGFAPSLLAWYECAPRPPHGSTRSGGRSVAVLHPSQHCTRDALCVGCRCRTVRAYGDFPPSVSGDGL